MNSKNKYEAIYQLIDSKNKKVEMYETNIKENFNSILKENFEEYSKRYIQYYDSYKEYLNILDSFENVEKVTPLEAFPGIRTIKSSTDLEAMKNNSIKMEKLARDIRDLALSLEKRESDLIADIKRTESFLFGYLASVKEIQEALTQIMEDKDSVYDIGFLSKTVSN